MRPLERIRSLLVNLPEGDQQLGEQFIQSRDFDSLKELVDSAIYKIRKELKKENPKEDYLNLDIEVLTTLKAEVDTYQMSLGIPEDEEDDEESFNPYAILDGEIDSLEQYNEDY
jgi:hypothetical protein